MAFLGLAEQEVLSKPDEYLLFGLIMASTMVGVVLIDRLMRNQEVFRFAVSFVSCMLGFFLFMKLHTHKEASAVTFTSAVWGFANLIKLSQKEGWILLLYIASAIVGLLCYALSSSFNDLFGKWNALKIILYVLFSSIALVLVWFVKQVSFLRHRGAPVKFLVWTSTTVYSFFSDKAAKGTPDAYSIVSCFAFAIMSFCCEFEELLYFFCGVLTAEFMKTKMVLGFVGISFSYFLIVADVNVLDELKRLVVPPTKQEVWTFLGVASTVINMLWSSLGDNPFSYFKIFTYGVGIPTLSGFLFSKNIPRQPYLRIIHLKAQTAIIMMVWSVGSVLYPFILDDIKHGDAYKLVSWGSLAVMQHAIPMPTIYRICCFYVFTHAFVVKLMGIKFLLDFVVLGFALFHSIFSLYLDLKTPPPEHVGIQDQPVPQVVSSDAVGSPQDEVQLQVVAVVEAEDSPQFSEGQPPQFVSSDEGVASPQASDEEQPQLIMDEASLQSTATP
ncbi:hypothetical protein PIB30_078723 [Stylosanthes scabra]|uniref:Uncharacterized protein n=1 Tax=Stylosanthes scabra TaxID=79078 RepID=A0ABU6VUF4_9FABA|nr:hypothetical protein [Stylosanthes scabra]